MAEARLASGPIKMTYTAGSALSAGAIVNVGSTGFPRAGVLATDLASGETGEVYLQGVFRITAKDSEGISQGDTVGWDDDPGEAVLASDSGANWPLGVALEDQDATNNLVLVELTPPAIVRWLNFGDLPTSEPATAGLAWGNTLAVTVSDGA